MKQFFEQYGVVALGILALLVLIAMITPVGNIIKTSLQGTTETFSTKIESQTDTMTAQMQEAFEEASAERYYDDEGDRLNGIIDRTLYVDGVAYRNLWNESENHVDSIAWGWRRTTTENGYKFEAIGTGAFHSPYIHDIAYSTTGWQSDSPSQYFELKDGYKYIIYSSNSVFDQILYDYCDDNKNALGPITYTHSTGANGKFEKIGRKGIISEKYDASYFSLRIGVLNVPTSVGTILETDFMVFEVPEDITVDLSNL